MLSFIKTSALEEIGKMWEVIKRQQDKLIKKGKYISPPYHLGQENPRP